MGEPSGSDAGREREELTFLVGTACSRVINLLMDPTADPAELRGELAFLADRAGRLAELLPAPDGDEDAAGSDQASAGDS